MGSFSVLNEHVFMAKKILLGSIRAYVNLNNVYLFVWDDYAFLANEVDLVRVGGIYYIAFFLNLPSRWYYEYAEAKKERQSRTLTFTIPLLYDLPPSFSVDEEIVKQAFAFLSGGAVRENSVRMPDSFVDSTFYTYVFLASLDAFLSGAYEAGRETETFKGYFVRMTQLFMPIQLIGNVDTRTIANPLVRWIYVKTDVNLAVASAMSGCGYADPSAILDPSIIDQDCAQKVVKHLKALIKGINILRYKKYQVLSSTTLT